MKVLVTGGSGFIGSHIVDKLIQDHHEVLAVDDLSTGHKSNLNEKASFVHCCINSSEFQKAVESFKPEAIIHQAAQVSVQKSIHDPLKDEEINIRGSLNVIECAKKYGVKKIVFASTAAVYGNPVSLPIGLAHPIQPLSPYGLSKFTVEGYLKLTSELHGISYTILRYANVYGPRQDANGEGGVIAIFAEALSKGTAPKIFGDGEQTRDFVYVEDVAAANVKALEAGENTTLNISSNDKISINELFFLMNEISGSSFQPDYQAERSGDIRESVLSNEESKKVLNWEPVVSLPKGLQLTMDHYKKTLQ
ncbi:NAD-dependent epimerase/dehydratase family protein [Bacillus lacus]|uniref:NAD-dependent epimerase/dehydratase family protein n=2 Tax=Metabacillus lacus TaxID=1983721 RepID=A0A7X2M0U8_9BACI|nr:NAD-dependent epimerase/dehydratase family protein [Metabacillus lacus]MRX73672.1 NAD-dependent epimerase/dehydratase family protein [Metabacillus lacus]